MTPCGPAFTGSRCRRTRIVLSVEARTFMSRRDDDRFPARTVENGKGTALVAARDLPAGTVIARFEGPLVPFTEVPREEIRHALWFDGDRWMIPTSDARYLNH